MTTTTLPLLLHITTRSNKYIFYRQVNFTDRMRAKKDTTRMWINEIPRAKFTPVLCKYLPTTQLAGFCLFVLFCVFVLLFFPLKISSNSACVFLLFFFFFFLSFLIPRENFHWRQKRLTHFFLIIEKRKETNSRRPNFSKGISFRTVNN